MFVSDPLRVVRNHLSLRNHYISCLSDISHVSLFHFRPDTGIGRLRATCLFVISHVLLLRFMSLFYVSDLLRDSGGSELPVSLISLLYLSCLSITFQTPLDSDSLKLTSLPPSLWNFIPICYVSDPRGTRAAAGIVPTGAWRGSAGVWAGVQGARAAAPAGAAPYWLRVSCSSPSRCSDWWVLTKP